MGRISFKGMIWLFVSAILLIVSIFFPWWGLRLIAPQYPEGLYMYVFPYKMEGDIDIINGLNHYIGMGQFAESDFPELTYLPYIVGAVALITIIVALVRKRSILLTWAGVIIILSLVGVFDIYRWLKSYGTNLDPAAPIEQEPFVPPIIGTNQLANFETLSFFTYGSAIMGAAIIIILLVLWKGKEKNA